MKNIFRNKIFIAVLLVVFVGGIIALFFIPANKLYMPRVQPAINEPLRIPEITNVVENSGRIPERGVASTPIIRAGSMSDGDAANAHFTLKEAYAVALPAARAYANDLQLAFIKSQNMLTALGKSSEWQIVFASAQKKGGYEVIVFGEGIALTREVPASTEGYALPAQWYDSGDALLSLSTLPQFATATVSSMSFFYNQDSDHWGYAFDTSQGTISMPVK